MAIVPGHPDINRRLLDYEARADECWQVRTWRPDGYAQVGRGGETLVHRIAWSAHHDQPVPDGYDVHHECETRNCVNPAHLALMTSTEHRVLHHPPTVLTHPPTGQCSHGHDWSTFGKLTTQLRWVCLECGREATRRHDAKRRPKHT